MAQKKKAKYGKMKMKRGSIVEPSKRLQFGDVVSGATSRAKAKEGDKTYSKAVGLPEGATTRSRVVYDKDGNRIGRRVASSTPKYVPDERNAGSRSKQAADYINRSRGKTKAEMEAERRERERNATTSTVPRQSAEPDGPPAPSRPSTPSRPRRRTPEARRPAPRMESMKGKKATTVQRDTPKRELMTAKAKPASTAPKASESSGKMTRPERIMARATKKANKIKDRRAGKAGKKAKKEDIKAAKMQAKNLVRGAKGKPMKKAMSGKMMKYKPGNFKPDYLDMDKDGNKNEPMKKALKDRRGSGGYGKKRR